MTKHTGSTAIPAADPTTQIANVQPANAAATGTTIANVPESVGYTQEEMALIYGSISDNTDLSKDVIVSRISIMQAASPEVASQVAGYKVGMLVDNRTRGILTTFTKAPWMTDKGINADELNNEHVALVLVITRLPSEYILWKKRDTEGTGFHWKTLDKDDARVVAGTWPVFNERDPVTGKAVAPPVTDNTNFLLLPLDVVTRQPLGIPIVGSFNKTSAKAGKSFARSVEDMKVRRLLPWQQAYYIKTSSIPNPKGGPPIWTMSMVPGPLLKTFDLDSSMERHCKKTALELGDREHGRARQVAVINSAMLDHDDTPSPPQSGTEVNGGQKDDGEPF